MFRGVCVLALVMTLAAEHARAQVVLSPTAYELDVEVNFEDELLHGTARITLSNPSKKPVREASLLLYRLMRVRAVQNDRGRELPFSQTVVPFEDFGKLQVNQVLVRLPKSLAPGAKTVLQIQYDGHLLGYAETGMLYIKDRIDPEFTILRDDSYAYPQPGYPSRSVNRSAPEWNFTYAARITVPAGHVVANGGHLESADTLSNKVTFRFKSLKPSWRMDFAIAAYSRLSSSRIHVYHLPGDGEGAAGVAQAAEKALDLFTSWFGPPGGTSALTFIEIPDGWGSQADVTTVIQSAAAFRDPKRHREVYHEISHLWNVTPTDRPSPRWDEGLASFLEFLAAEELDGASVVDARATQLVEWLCNELPGHPEWGETPLIEYGQNGLTDLSYSVGALFFDLLYRLEGRDTFNAMIRKYCADFSRQGGSTNDFADLATRMAGTPRVSQLADDWLLTTAWADRIQHSTSIEDLVGYYRGGDPQDGD